MEIQNDIQFNIATAPKRTTAVWKNATWAWSRLLDKLSDSKETKETAVEYETMSKAEKSAIKDIGGFVGGYLKDGVRSKANIGGRQLVCLDADDAGKNYMTLIRRGLAHCAWAVYSTHSHTSDHPRVRIVIPMTREVTPDEYIAVSRKVAGKIGIDMFDPTTFAPERLMYWPSRPKGMRPVFEFADAPIMDPDRVLAAYRDWTDSSTWPTAKSEEAARHYSAKKQGNPKTKPGFIGAFNRAYTISQAIEGFIPGIYEPCGKPNRYTYVGGETTGGLVTYEDEFAYSFHATDPASEKLCNAFDMVRIHMFGNKDCGCDSSVPVNKLPSYTAMMDFVRTDDLTKKELAAEQAQELQKAFNDDLLDEPDDEQEKQPTDGKDKKKKAADKTDGYKTWPDKLIVSRSGRYEPRAENVLLILENEPRLKSCMAIDDFSHRCIVQRDLPWRKLSDGDLWTDTDDACLRNFISRYYKIQARGIIDDAVAQYSSQRHFHPVQSYLAHLPEWDKQERVDRLWIDYLGAEDTEYTRTTARLFMRAAIARVMHPGVKFDYVIVLAGGQGIGKSTLIGKLGYKWYTDSITSFVGKDPIEQLQGQWIVEVGEMQAAKKAESEQIKAFISRQVDKIRLPYGHRTAEYPRQCVFIGSTNDKVFLKDRTGNRRFWPVNVRRTDDDEPPKNVMYMTQDDVDQLWAEAMADYKVNYKDSLSLRLPGDLEAVARTMQEEHMEGQEEIDRIRTFLDIPIPANWYKRDLFSRQEYIQNYSEDPNNADTNDTFDDCGEPQKLMQRTKMCAMEVYCELLGGSKNDSYDIKIRTINNIMQNMPGWEYYGGSTSKLRFGAVYGLQRAYVRRKNGNGRNQAENKELDRKEDILC